MTIYTTFCGDSGHKLWDKIPADTIVYRDDGVTMRTLYYGSPGNLRRAPLKWRKDPDLLEHGIIDPSFLTLDEIRQQHPRGHLRLFIEDPLYSEVWEIGNYPNDQSWIVTMKGVGYA